MQTVRLGVLILFILPAFFRKEASATGDIFSRDTMLAVCVVKCFAFNTLTRLCNILRFFTAVKVIIFR